MSHENSTGVFRRTGDINHVFESTTNNLDASAAASLGEVFPLIVSIVIAFALIGLLIAIYRDAEHYHRFKRWIDHAGEVVRYAVLGVPGSLAIGATGYTLYQIATMEPSTASNAGKVVGVVLGGVAVLAFVGWLTERFLERVASYEEGPDEVLAGIARVSDEV